MEDTQKAQKGTWTLIAPDGRKWQDESPLKVAAKEMRERVPERVGVQRILDAIGVPQPDDSANVWMCACGYTNMRIDLFGWCLFCGTSYRPTGKCPSGEAGGIV